MRLLSDDNDSFFKIMIAKKSNLLDVSKTDSKINTNALLTLCTIKKKIMIRSMEMKREITSYNNENEFFGMKSPIFMPNSVILEE